ncbi:MAG TPA: C4-dicarboxylate ABC transporter permease, partial [Clostridiaceae bacterium]|nr:C4-dicarboxylate ABC transporter permease [Clostridiaceae bacterium]
MDFLIQGLGAVLSPANMLLVIGGVFLGIVVGAIPGLTATLAISLLVPFTFSMDPVPAMVLLLSIYCGGICGGSITAILIRTPGTPGAACTVLDGYPMAQKGRAGEALGIATLASGFGGFTSAILMIFLSQQIASFALSFSGPEYTALAFFGLAVIFSMTKDLVKGLITGLFGLLIATVGMDLITPYPRFTMGSSQLLTGFPMLPIVIGLFAVAEVFRMIETVVRNGKKEEIMRVGRIIPSKNTMKKIFPTMIRSTFIGTFVGALPGAGANVAAFVSYNTAKNLSKTPERFGQGAEEGIAASETANNAVTGGALIPMLTLGIPGDAVTAVLLSALTIQGLQPGP